MHAPTGIGLKTNGETLDSWQSQDSSITISSLVTFLIICVLNRVESNPLLETLLNLFESTYEQKLTIT